MKRVRTKTMAAVIRPTIVSDWWRHDSWADSSTLVGQHSPANSCWSSPMTWYHWPVQWSPIILGLGQCPGDVSCDSPLNTRHDGNTALWLGVESYTSTTLIVHGVLLLLNPLSPSAYGFDDLNTTHLSAHTNCKPKYYLGTFTIVWAQL